ncbi:hypothetical protein D3C85_1946660 [compost metagenome]
MRIVVTSRYIAKVAFRNKVSMRNTGGTNDILSSITSESIRIVVKINSHTVNLYRLADVP